MLLLVNSRYDVLFGVCAEFSFSFIRQVSVDHKTFAVRGHTDAYENVCNDRDSLARSDLYSKRSIVWTLEDEESCGVSCLCLQLVLSAFLLYFCPQCESAFAILGHVVCLREDIFYGEASVASDFYSVCPSESGK